VHGRARLSDASARRRRPTRAGATVTAGVLLVGSALAGCARAPEVVTAPQASAGVCASARWPASVSGHERVATEPDVPSAAAWGDPAIIARCGLAPLGPTTDQCVAVDDVDWVVRPLSDGTKATTYGRDPAIEVLVPSAYGPAPLLLPVFTDLARTLPSTGRRCS
jgi:hypothetical protein